MLHEKYHLFTSSFNFQVRVHFPIANSFALFHVSGNGSNEFQHNVRYQNGRQQTASRILLSEGYIDAGKHEGRISRYTDGRDFVGRVLVT